MKKLAPHLLITVLIIGLFWTAHFDFVHASTPVSGILNANTTWTKEDSPYVLDGNVLVSNGVTLTIEPGTTVDLGSFYLMVNGTLVARGTSEEQIMFQSGEIIFAQSSSAWNDQTGSGCIINYALFTGTSITINDASPMISNTLSGPVLTSSPGGSAIIVNGGSPLISNNSMDGGQVTVNSGSSIIFGNTIRGSQAITVNNGSPIISKNNIQGGIGIQVEAGNPIISDNNISNCETGIIANSGTIERNYIYAIIEIENVTLENNTVISTIYVQNSGTPTIIYNNLNQNQDYGEIVLHTSNNVDAANNWWGTTNSSAIAQKIYDYYDDFNLGIVDYTPFLTAPNPEAMPDPNAPILTPNPTQTANPTSQPTNPQTQTPTATPQQPNTQSKALLGLNWEEIAIIGLVAAVVVLTAATLFYRGKSAKQTKQP